MLKFAHSEDFSFTHRLDQATQPFLGTPYQLSPLGEARGEDPDPRFRIDAFDCTTFVETAIAISHSADWSKAADILDQIRYDDGKKHFEDRRHFITANWLPSLQEENFLTDITSEIGGPKTKNIRFKVTKKKWKYRRIAKNLVLPKRKRPLGTHQLPIIPISAFKKKGPQIPSGSLVNIVRVPVNSAPLVVTHQGLYFLDKDGVAWIRHASPVAKRVIDEPFNNMLRRYRKPRKWPIAGFNFQRIIEPKPPKK